MHKYFLHGLDSSSQGTKGRWFARHFPEMFLPDFNGTLEERMEQLVGLCQKQDKLIFVGSSFGGLMAACYAILAPGQCHRLILLAPALNFDGYKAPEVKVTIPATVIIGQHDQVCPPDVVLPLAEQTFSNLTVSVVDDDHMLHEVFQTLPWAEWLEK